MAGPPRGGPALAVAAAPRRDKVLALAGVPVRLYLGGLFVWASVYKIREPYEFALNIATYQILPLELVNVFAIALPWLELATGVMLILGLWTKENALLLVGMMAMFTAALGIALSRGYQMNCGCFSSEKAAEEIGRGTLVRDIAWMALAIYTLLFDDGRYGVDGLLRKERRHA